MTHETSLRAIRRQDWRYLARLSLSAFPDATPAQVSETLRDASNVVVLEVDGKPAGYAAFRHERQGILWRDWMAIDPCYRSCGYGSMLVQAVESIAGRRGYSTIMLAVLKSNEGAFRFHCAHGYEVIGEDDRKYHMRKSVPQSIDTAAVTPAAPRSKLARVWDRLLYCLLVD